MPTAPFLKWAGGKRRLLPTVKAHFPRNFEAFLEPFVGGGALYFDIDPLCPLIADTNLRLIRTYRAVRNQVESVIDALLNHKNDEETFYAVRGSGALDSEDTVEVAAAFIFLNRTCFNGLYRTNSNGGFNVPFGRYERRDVCDATALRACSAALQGASIEHASFHETLPLAQPGDFAYCDPPYFPAKGTEFINYTPDGFGRDQHVRLRDLAVEARRKDVRVLISNSDVPAVRELYAGRSFRLVPLSAPRSIAANASRRGAAQELLIANY